MELLKYFFILLLTTISIVFIVHFYKYSQILKKNSTVLKKNSTVLDENAMDKPIISDEKKEIETQLNNESHLIRIEEPAKIQKEEQKNYKDNFHQFYEEIQDISNEPITFENMFRDQMKDNYLHPSRSLYS